jgi:hypothetical protein
LAQKRSSFPASASAAAPSLVQVASSPMTYLRDVWPPGILRVSFVSSQSLTKSCPFLTPEEDTRLKNDDDTQSLICDLAKCQSQRSLKYLECIYSCLCVEVKGMTRLVSPNIRRSKSVARGHQVAESSTPEPPVTPASESLSSTHLFRIGTRHTASKGLFLVLSAEHRRVVDTPLW